MASLIWSTIQHTIESCAEWKLAGCAEPGRKSLKRPEKVPKFTERTLDRGMPTIYSLGPFRLDVDGGILFRGAEPVPLGHRCGPADRRAVPRLVVPEAR